MKKDKPVNPKELLSDLQLLLLNVCPTPVCKQKGKLSINLKCGDKKTNWIKITPDTWREIEKLLEGEVRAQR